MATTVKAETQKIVKAIRRKALLTDSSVGGCDGECDICATAVAARRILKRLRLRNIA